MAKKRVVDQNGNALQSERELARKHAEVIHHYARLWEDDKHHGKLLENIRICPPKYVGDKWLIVFKGWEGDTQYVAFHRGGTMLGTIAGGLTKMAAGTLSWKEDEFARKRMGW